MHICEINRLYFLYTQKNIIPLLWKAIVRFTFLFSDNIYIYMVIFDKEYFSHEHFPCSTQIHQIITFRKAHYTQTEKDIHPFYKNIIKLFVYKNAVKHSVKEKGIDSTLHGKRFGLIANGY